MSALFGRHRDSYHDHASTTTMSTRRRLISSVEGSMGVMRASRKLRGHVSCVNVLEWTQGDGRWLVSGGDDSRILMWDSSGDMEAPSSCFNTPSGNVLCIAISALNNHVYCGGMFSDFCQYELGATTSASWTRRISHNDDSVRDIAAHPTNDHLVLTAGEDGIILLHDMRTPKTDTQPEGRIRGHSECTGVRYHPRLDHFFIACNSEGSVRLYDSRMAFRSGESRTSHSRSHVLQYVTRVTKPGSVSLAHPESSSVAFSREGDRFTVTFQGHYPTVYTLHDPHPIAICSSTRLPDGSPIPAGEKGYSNAATMKHGSWGGDSWYAAGSDDFRCYIWEIPPTDHLLDKRKEMGADEWLRWREVNNGVFAYASSTEQVPLIPENLCQPSCRVGGHKSIVNSAIFHPTQPLLSTAGIESYIRLHKPFAAGLPHVTSEAESGWTEGYLPTRQLPRSLPPHERTRVILRMLRDRSAGMSDPDTEDAHSMEMFDEILRQEGDLDIFASRLVGDEDDADYVHRPPADELDDAEETSNDDEIDNAGGDAINEARSSSETNDSEIVLSEDEA